MQENTKAITNQAWSSFNDEKDSLNIPTFINFCSNHANAKIDEHGEFDDFYPPPLNESSNKDYVAALLSQAFSVTRSGNLSLLTDTSRIGRVADWNNPNPNNSFVSDSMESSTSSSFDESGNNKGVFLSAPSSSSSASSRKSLKSSLKGNFAAAQRKNFPRNAASATSSHPSHHHHHHSSPAIIREPSVTIESSWKLVDEVEFSRLNKLCFTPEEEGVNLLVTGCINEYDKSADKISPKTERPIVSIPGASATNKQKLIQGITCPTIFEDENLLKYVNSNEPVLLKTDAAIENDDDKYDNGDDDNESSQKIRIISTDASLSLLLGISRSILPFDLVVKIINSRPYMKNVVIERRRSDLLFETANETSADGPIEDKEWNKEMAVVSFKLSKQLFPSSQDNNGKNGDSFDKCFVYRGIKLDDSTELMVRCDVGGHVPGSPSDFISFKALCETKSPSEWKAVLETQRSGMIANELRNNGFKIARLTWSALLAGSKQLKLAFCSKVSKDCNASLLGISTLFPNDFSEQINLNTSNGWGILKAIVGRLLEISPEKDSNEFALVRDANKPILRIYQK